MKRGSLPRYLTSIIILITSCNFQTTTASAPSTEVILEGYLATTRQHPDHITIEAAKNTYFIEQTEISEAVVNDPRQSANCLPDSLRSIDGSIRGKSFIARILTKADRQEVVALDFTQWEGTSGWWVHQIGANRQCHYIDDTP